MNTIKFVSLAHTRPTLDTLLTLEEYVRAVLDDTQRTTRDALPTPSCPPSGRGSEHETIPA